MKGPFVPSLPPNSVPVPSERTEDRSSGSVDPPPPPLPPSGSLQRPEEKGNGRSSSYSSQ